MHSSPTHHNARPASPAYQPTPTWLRCAIVAAAMIVLCSCTAAQPEYRIAETTTIRGQSPEIIVHTGSEVHLVNDPNIKPALHEQPPAANEGQASQVRLASAESTAQQTKHRTPAELKQPLSILPASEQPVQPAAAGQEKPTFEDAQLQPASCPAPSPATADAYHGTCACTNNCPVLGPHDEYLCDGGDYGFPAAVTADWHIEGLEQEDTIAHYDTIDGRTIVTPSNKLCIYAPRFAAVRQVIDVREYDRYAAVGGTLQRITPAPLADRETPIAALAQSKVNVDRSKQPPSLLRERQHPGELDRDRRVEESVGSLAPYANLQIVRTGELIGTDIVKVARSSLAAITWAGDQAAQVVLDKRRAQAEVSVQSPGTIYHLFEPNNPKLRLIKLASKSAAQPGEEVEFTLRFDNIGDRVIGNVTIADNLTTRLEYIEGSQKPSLPADFSTQANQGESLVLRWELKDPLPKHEGGVLRFRCRVR
jgi:uncharacterized repeat protein (TIGR01451 family)